MKKGEVHECGIVIVTVSLGILQSHNIKFKPCLPEWKLDAIDAVGFGNLNKVILEFDHAFWNDKLDYFGIIPVPDSDDLEDHMYEYHTRGFGFMWWSALKHSKTPILTGLIAGVMADNVCLLFFS